MVDTIYSARLVASITGSAIGGVGITPLMARSNKGNYTWIIIPIIIIIAAVGVWLVWRKISDLHKSPAWIKRNRERLTNKRDVSAIAKKIGLNSEESALLWDICREKEAPNIYYLVNDRQAFRDLFRSAYVTMKADGVDVDIRNELFRLLYKVEFSTTATVVNSSAAIPIGTPMTFVISRDNKFVCKLKDNTAETMTLSIPNTLAGKTDKPAPLSKVLIDFSLGDGMSYSFETRIVRYGKGIDNKSEVVLQNTVHNIRAKEATRAAKRVDMKVPCTFSAVKEVDGKFAAQDKKYASLLDNISADGCCITSTLPIKKGQHISVTLPLDKKYSAVGTIVQTRKNSTNGSFFLHIHFVQIDADVRNKIFEYVYSFGGDDTVGEGA